MEATITITATDETLKARPRTMATVTGVVADISSSTARKLKFPGYSTGRYSYTVDTTGKVERWANGFGGWCKNIDIAVNK